MENSMHWVLDVAFRADARCIRRDRAPYHRAILRCIALRVQQQSHRKVVNTLCRQTREGAGPLIRISQEGEAS